MVVRVSQTKLLERSEDLGQLVEALEQARSGGGQVVLVSGEAGIGKTALLRGFVSEANGSLSLLAGACEPLFIPRPMGPLIDMAVGRDGELARRLERGARPHEVAQALLAELREGRPTLVTIEDLHWADDATLDVIRLLARRIADVPALLVCTFRDDELGRSHPLKRLLGEVASTPSVVRVRLRPLSESAVAELARPYALDPVELFRNTAGNPFFVTEVLAGGGLSVPAAVSDAVMARAARLSATAVSVLEAVAVAPPLAEAWLLEAIVANCAAALEECLSSGMLVSRAHGVAFRHELARTAVDESLNPVHRRTLHRQILATLEQQPEQARDVTRLAHHAEAAGDVEALLRYAPRAGDIASSRGAPREASAHYQRVLRWGHLLDPLQLGALYAKHAHQVYMTDKFEPAIASQRAAIACYERTGDRLRTADALRELTHLLRCGGQHGESHRAAQEGLRLLEGAPPGPELAFGYATQAFLCMCGGDREGTFDWGRRAIELAEKTGAQRALLHALNSVGTMEMVCDIEGGAAKLLRSLDLALGLDLDEDVGRAYLNFAGVAAYTHRFDGLNPFIEAGLEFCSQRGLDLWACYLIGSRAFMALQQGNWALAVDLSQRVLRLTSSSLPRQTPQQIIALVRARRRDPEWQEALEECLATGLAAGELQTVAPAKIAEAEIAWLQGRAEEIPALTDSTFEWARREREPWSTGGLAIWRRRAGVLEDVVDWLPEPHLVELQGNPRRAAQAWADLGCPYDAALALGSAEDVEASAEAHARLLKMGASAAAGVIGRRLREGGRKCIPRGPRPSTLDNPAGLTSREVEVARLLAQGLTNAAIAKRLFLSPKTVDHHVSAILGKLHAATRNEAATRLVSAARSEGQAQFWEELPTLGDRAQGSFVQLS
jgi:DNA-binding CsgD family transcriptional regulator